MSPLFGNKDEKRAQDAAAEAEAQRLVALPVEELATEILPAYGSDGPGRGEKSINILQIGSFMMRNFPRGASHIRPLLEPLREGVQRLEHSELVRTQIQSTGGGRTTITRRGLDALASGNPRQYVATLTGS